MKDTRRLILASSSPRRRELMQKLGIPFTVEVPAAEEIAPPGMKAEEIPEYFAGIKAEDVWKRHRGEPVTVIGSDTIVLVDDVIFGKPKDKEDAFRMLRSLSGRWHRVLTGAVILSGVPGEAERCAYSFTSVTGVKFYELEDAEIRTYIEKENPVDKAGAYGIQDDSDLFVERIDGDYNTVVGFPLAAVWRILKKL